MDVTQMLKKHFWFIFNFGSGNSQGFNLSTSTDSGSVVYVKGINAVSNPDDFDINLVSTGIVRRHHSYVFDKIVDMVVEKMHSSLVMLLV